MDNPNTPDEGNLHKRPLKLIKFAIDQVVKTGIPLHLQKLQNQRENIEKYRSDHDWISLQNEQINASNTVRLLKSDIRELEDLNCQVEDKDQERFLQIIQAPTREVVDALASFLELNSDVMLPLPESENDSLLVKDNIPLLVCDRENTFDKHSNVLETESKSLMQLQIHENPVGVLKRWEKLKKDITEVSELFKKLASSVFSQKASVDTIESNAQQATDNVIGGAKHLKKAVALQAALLPFAGAAIGGLLGPVGAVVGFNVCGSIACALGGSALGFGLGYKIKRKHINSNDIEMKALTASSKRISQSASDLQLSLNNKTESKKDC